MRTVEFFDSSSFGLLSSDYCIILNHNLNYDSRRARAVSVTHAMSAFTNNRPNDIITLLIAKHAIIIAFVMSIISVIISADFVIGRNETFSTVPLILFRHQSVGRSSSVQSLRKGIIN